jgi:hypothetical protein
VLQALAAKDATLVLGPHTIYELVRTFTGSKPNSKEQALKLFSCIKKFLDAGIPCSKQLMDLVGGEAVAFGRGQASINPLMSDDDRKVLCEEVDKLAAGNLEQRVPDFIEKRTAFVLPAFEVIHVSIVPELFKEAQDLFRRLFPVRPATRLKKLPEIGGQMSPTIPKAELIVELVQDCHPSLLESDPVCDAVWLRKRVAEQKSLFSSEMPNEAV